jgi:hypothetical protein
MKNLLTAVLCALYLGLFSCQKEVNDLFKVNGTSGNTAGTLKKAVYKQNSDSSVNEYFYDNSGRIIGVNITNVSSGSFDYNNETIERNSQGMIQKIITKASQLSQNGIDSLVATVASSSGHYVSRKISLSALGVSASLNSFFYYDASGKIISQKDYVDDGLGNVDSSRTDYTYSGSNLLTINGYNLNAGSTTPDATYLFEYDSKTSPLVVGNESYVLNNFLQWFSANNVTKNTVNVAGDPVTHVETWSYAYNSANKPVSANIISDGQTNITMNYYYN